MLKPKITFRFSALSSQTLHNQFVAKRRGLGCVILLPGKGMFKQRITRRLVVFFTPSPHPSHPPPLNTFCADDVSLSSSHLPLPSRSLKWRKGEKEASGSRGRKGDDTPSRLRIRKCVNEPRVLNRSVWHSCQCHGSQRSISRGKGQVSSQLQDVNHMDSSRALLGRR